MLKTYPLFPLKGIRGYKIALEKSLLLISILLKKLRRERIFQNILAKPRKV